MKRLLLSGLVSLALSPLAGMAANYFNPNGGVVSSPIDIHAANFTNYGTFSFNNFNIGLPFETWDTLNFYNKGRMTCSPGWRFNTLSSANGSRRMAANFVNENPGVIRAVDSSASFVSCFPAVYDPSYLLISATNITTGSGVASSGGASLIVGANGRLELVGTNLNLSRSGLGVLPLWDQPFGSGNNETNFYPDVAVYDRYWVQTNFNADYKLNSGALWDGFTARAPFVPGPTTGPARPTYAPSFSLDSPEADSYINVAKDGYLQVIATNRNKTTYTVNLFTNINKGAVFVSAPPGMSVQLGFTGPYENNFNTIRVLLSIQQSNAATTLSEDAYIYVQDTLASQPPPDPPGSRGLLPNKVGCPANTFRPANYLFSRQDSAPGLPGNQGYPVANFFTSSGNQLVYTNKISLDSVSNAVTEVGDFAGYSAFFDNTVTRSAAVAGGGVTNLPGRIHILADTLDLSQARLRAEGEILIQTTRLIASSNAVVDCENLRFNLTSAAGNLKVQNLSKDFVTRLRGQLYAWSAVWSNSAVVVIPTNYAFSNEVITLPDGTTTSNERPYLEPITNTVSLSLHTLMLNATELQTVLPVSVYELTTHSTNVVIHDNLSLIQTLSLDARSLTLEGNLRFPGYYPPNPVTGYVPPIPAIQNWTYPLAPNLLYFTNHGTLTIPNEAHFGDDGLKPYSVLVNTGRISAASLQLHSAYVENRGDLSAWAGSLILQGGTGKLEKGSSTSGGEMQFWFGHLKLDHYQALANDNAIHFWITNSLADAGPGSANVLVAQNGFNLQLKPTTGDLLGTTLQSTAVNVPSVRINHVWAGQDRGPGAAGYSNNVAVGRLVLATYGPHPVFYFAGTGVSNALYADTLDLSQLTDYANQLQMAPNLILYYAAARLGFTPPPTNGVAQLPEEYLDGQFDGHLRWVRNFAGPNSSVDLVINGSQTLQVNRALRNSKIIDSDGDGVPNYYDLDGIFATAPLVVQVTGNGGVAPDYNGQSLMVGQSYTVVAQPANGAAFSGWTGGASASSPQLTFVMQSNLVLTANFTNLALVAGTYSGLFYEDAGVALSKSGFFTASTTAGRAYSGALTIGRNRYSFSGQLNASGRATNAIPRSGAASLTLQLQAGDQRITGTVGDGSWQAALTAERNSFHKLLNPAAFAGTYTIAFPGTGDPADPQSPSGDGYGTVTVDAAGKIKFTGSLADGTKLTQSVSASNDRQWPLFVPLYGGNGQLLGWLTFGSVEHGDAGGWVSWIKQSGAGAKYYPAGFDLDLEVTGSLYNSLLNPVTGFGGGRVALTGGNLAADVVNEVTIANNRVMNLSSNKLSLKLNRGLFSGSVVDPATRKAVKFNGVILQNQGLGTGYFLGTNQSGSVRLAPWR